MSKKKKTPTSYDVAKLAGVSPSTVSRFLNRTSYVSTDKHQKIESAMKELGYKPRFQMEHSLSRRSMTIGVLIQHPDSPYTSQILNDMEKILRDQGYSLVIASGHWQRELETHAIEYLLKSNVDGIIVVTGNLKEELILNTAKLLPVVVVGHQIDAKNIRSINLDHIFGGYLATLHLLQLGHVNIAHIKGLQSQPDAEARYIGYQQALQAYDIEVNERLVKQGDFGSELGYAQALELIESQVHFSALFAANDQTAYGAIKALQDYGYRVPEDISVIGFDDLNVSKYFTPALTTLRQPIEEMGAVCAHSILNLLTGSDFDTRLPPIDLIIRQSTKSLYR